MVHHEVHRTITAASIEARGDATIGEAFFDQLPAWVVGGNISKLDSRFLAGLANFAGARRAVEIGVASGWSSAVLLTAMSKAGGEFSLSGIDLSPTYYLDPTIPTGQAVHDVAPALQSNYRLLTGRVSFDAMDDVGALDFAFIDGHHMHPWATLDFVSILPFIGQGRWVVLHDLNLCRWDRHKHTNRGPFYLFNMWQDQKFHSTQDRSLIGAVFLNRKPSDYLSDLLEILYTPWEEDIGEETLTAFLGFTERHYGSGWRDRFGDACLAASRHLKR